MLLFFVLATGKFPLTQAHHVLPPCLNIDYIFAINDEKFRYSAEAFSN